MRASLRNVLLSMVTALGMFAASASQAANDFATDTDAHSLLGSYLAANLAKGANDNNSASAFYRSALTLDPSNAVLLEQAFQTEAAEVIADDPAEVRAGLVIDADGVVVGADVEVGVLEDHRAAIELDIP